MSAGGRSSSCSCGWGSGLVAALLRDLSASTLDATSAAFSFADSEGSGAETGCSWLFVLFLTLHHGLVGLDCVAHLDGERSVLGEQEFQDGLLRHRVEHIPVRPQAIPALVGLREAEGVCLHLGGCHVEVFLEPVEEFEICDIPDDGKGFAVLRFLERQFARDEILSGQFAFAHLGCVEGLELTAAEGKLDEPLVAHLELREGDVVLVVLVRKDIGEPEVLVEREIERRGLERGEHKGVRLADLERGIVRHQSGDVIDETRLLLGEYGRQVVLRSRICDEQVELLQRSNCGCFFCHDIECVRDSIP